MAALQQIWLCKIIGSTLPVCQNTTMRVNGAWIKRYCVLCSKTYNTLHIGCHNFPAGSRQAARVARICETSLLTSHMWPELWRALQWNFISVCAVNTKLMVFCKDWLSSMSFAPSQDHIHSLHNTSVSQIVNYIKIKRTQILPKKNTCLHYIYHNK